MNYLSGLSQPILCGVNQGYSTTACRRLRPNKPGGSPGALQDLQRNYERAGGYPVPGGVIAGGNDWQRAGSPSLAIDRGQKVWYLVTPDPTGLTASGEQIRTNQGRPIPYEHFGRAYELSGPAKELLRLGSRAEGTFRGYSSSKLWLEQNFAPHLLTAVEASATAALEGRDRVTTAAAKSKRESAELERRKQRARSGLGWDLPPWLIPVGVLGVGLVWWQRRK